MLQKMDNADFDKVFALMEESFPSDEYRNYIGQKKLLDNPLYEIFVVKNSETADIEAIAAIWDFGENAYIEHLAVSPKLRCGGMGSKILGELAQNISKPLCLEVELPECDIAKRRIGFYERCGYYLNDYPYMQPSLSEGKKSIPLMIMTYGGKIGRDEFENLKNLLYKEVYKVLKSSTADEISKER